MSTIDSGHYEALYGGQEGREKRAKVGDALRGGISWRCSDAVNSQPRKGYDGVDAAICRHRNMP
ncbi:hypothetical protein, partial [Microbulbifer sp. S227A]|uniref:hypothetical protein n=1 Tax=Microbulbifer sp. S227A TaxID=3415131 RepID=UPI003C7B21F8